ncbi:paraneoplastic antigen Ma1 homolog, partial [Austrofundulus limnaeus]|uniref:Paraneoplastic antigen Ma1 homolog n=1 Tax=Austrofundulus limnaeus TaxID=52670 RepID=A0A2I4AKL6_AUSLI
MEVKTVHLELESGLREWCQGESLDEDHVVLVLVPKGTEVAQIEETMETVKALGRVRVRGRMYNKKVDRLMVLCECRERVDPTKVPTDVQHVSTGISWPVIMSARSSATEGDAPESFEALFHTAPPTSSPESIIRAMGDVLTKMDKPSGENSSYRRLRMFSGTLPTPAGEETLEHWLEQARLMVEESDCSDKEKRRRLMECLRGPALAVIKAIRTAEADVSPSKCLDAIECAFDTAESGEDLYFKFRLMQQEKHEKLSDFLKRVEQSLTKVVRKDGIPTSRVDAARVEQLMRGAIHSDLMLVQLKLRERKQNPPNFLELLTEIRAEEEYAAARVKLSASVHRVKANNDMDSHQTDIQSLKAEIKELKSMVDAMKTKPLKPVDHDKESFPSHQSPKIESCENAEIVALKKQVQRLQKKVSSKTAKDYD